MADIQTQEGISEVGPGQNLVVNVCKMSIARDDVIFYYLFNSCSCIQYKCENHVQIIQLPMRDLYLSSS
jgi:hypothetical protein